VMSFSKMFAWTGLRAGFIISSPELIGLIKRVPMGVCPIAAPIQRAGIVALREGWDFVDMMRREYLKRIEFCVERLNEIPGIRCVKPEGTFYVFPDISETNLKSMDYCEKLLEAEGVAVVPGLMYGDVGEGHVRLALVKPIDVLEDVLNRIERFTRKIMG
ncbi:MAG TPA: aminotransferase class I/II-fold pyridoxal phosphate-dependent enzyme, partial [Candidatus Atribacteria bacterium]|nr:aminotransferase class I/II-fold pyridoxal phosphate-dependent enzyme [Candidatus Atribacteria bacterium]